MRRYVAKALLVFVENMRGMYNKYKKKPDMNVSKQNHTEDQLKQVLFLRDSYLNDFKEQDNQYKDLTAKITFLFGCSVSVLTLYGTYAEDVNAVCKWVAFVLFTITLGLLCFAYCSRTFKKPDRLDTSVDKTLAKVIKKCLISKRYV